MAEAKKRVKGTTPKGEARWFKLTKPDQKFKKYTVDLVLEDTPETRKLLDLQEEMVEKRYQEELAKAKTPADKKKVTKSKFQPIEPEYDAEGKETGRFIAKFRGKSERMNREKEVYQVQAPAIFNSKAQLFSSTEKDALRVFNGSIVQIAYEIESYYTASIGAGITLVPKAAIIHKLAESGADASQFGFAASEFEQDEEEFTQQEAKDEGEQDF